MHMFAALLPSLFSLGDLQMAVVGGGGAGGGAVSANKGDSKPRHLQGKRAYMYWVG